MGGEIILNARVIEEKFLGKKVLILTDREFFAPLTGRNDVNADVINYIIRILTGNGIAVEVEEVIDCKTETFHRSGENTFDFALYISERSIDGFWGGLDLCLFTKISESYCLTELPKELKNSNSSALNTKDIIDFLTQIGILGNNQNDITNHAIEHLIKELEYSMASKNNLRSDMLIRVLLCNEHLDIAQLLGCLDWHPNPEKIVSRVFQILSEQIELPEIVNLFGDNNTLEEFDLSNVKIAVLASEIENINSFFKKAKSLKELSRSLFLECKSYFSGKVMLNLGVEKKKFGSVLDAWIINNNWIEDVEILEQWTKISPNDEESWQVYSRVLWNKGMKLKCSEVAKKGLEYHPKSANLLRRRAHGLRIKEKHAEAVEIEKILLQSDKLSKVDTVIYLVRSLVALKEWGQVLKYTELGLELKPELEEFHKNKLQAQENIQ